ncbi:MAG: hypothetical protein QOI38_2783 [Sphingomonadales bacterium]|jgi:uncharacterized protein (DUF1697 family)|nr:hypothetical protein [Sphingomonadales bacterium]
MGRHVALLRAVNVGGRKLPMADLRALCAELGWTDAATYIQSGNLVFSAEGKEAELENALEKAIAGRFGLEVPAIVRSAAAWRRLAKANPFPDVAAKEPNRLMLLLSKRPPATGAEDAIAAKAAAGEDARRAGEALWIHYPQGAGTSKLTPALIDRAVGSPATQRNFNTVLKIEEML